MSQLAKMFFQTRPATSQRSKKSHNDPDNEHYVENERNS